jgi:threonine dehydrogenase-like Zn-dependent dehydrogenase
LPALKEMTGGRGPDACIDAVGMESHAPGLLGAYDRAKQAVRPETDRPIALREAIMACRNGGTVSVIGVYGGFVDKFPAGPMMNRSITIKTGQCHVQRYLKRFSNEFKTAKSTLVCNHSQTPSRRGAAGFQDVPRQTRRVHQDCLKT